MKTINTRNELFAAMCNGDYERFYLKGRYGFIMAVEREDGSGFSFNVTMNHNSNPKNEYVLETFHVRFKL